MLCQIWLFTIHGKTWKNYYNNNEFKISSPTWNEEFELPDESYSVSDIPDFFECIFKKSWKKRCNIVNNDYQQDSRVLYIFVPNKPFGSLLEISQTSSFVHIDNKKKYIVNLGEGPTHVLDNTTLTAEKKYLINFTVTRNKFCLDFHYNRGKQSFVC